MLRRRCCVEMWTQAQLRALGDTVQGKDAAYAALEVLHMRAHVQPGLCVCPVKT